MKESTIAKRPILHLTKWIEIPRNSRAGVVKNYSTRLAKLAFSRVMNNILTRPNVGDRQQCRSWHRFILSHPQKTGTDRDSSTRQSVSPNICLLDTSALLLCATQREEKNFSLFLMVSSLYRIEETSSSGRKLSTTAQLSQTRLMEINDGIQLATRINQSNSTWLWVLSCCCCTIHDISRAKEDTHLHNILLFVPKMKSRAKSVLYRVI